MVDIMMDKGALLVGRNAQADFTHVIHPATSRDRPIHARRVLDVILSRGSRNIASICFQ